MIHTIFLPYAGHADEAPALAFAAALSGKLKAKVDAAFVCRALHPFSGEENAKVGQVYEREGYYASQDFARGIHQEHLKKHAAGAKAAFEAFHKGNPNQAQFAWAGAIDLFYDPEQVFKKHACLHDLTVASVHFSPSVRDELVDGVLFASGRPVLFVGDAAPGNDELVAVIGWKPSAQSLHAIDAALPLLQVAARCHVVAIQEAGKDALVPSADDIVGYLAARGVLAEAHTYPASDAQPQLLLGDYYKKAGANLMVLGAYSHSRMKELVLGGFTQHFLGRREYNVLMAH